MNVRYSVYRRMREKLMQLLEEADDFREGMKCEDCSFNGRDCWLRLTADHLIATV